jgi:hypothetical protein
MILTSESQTEEEEEAKEEDDEEEEDHGPKAPSDNEDEQEDRKAAPVVSDLFGGSLTGNIPAPTSTTGLFDAPMSSSGTAAIKSPRSPAAHFDAGFDDHLEDHDEVSHESFSLSFCSHPLFSSVSVSGFPRSIGAHRPLVDGQDFRCLV